MSYIFVTSFSFRIEPTVMFRSNVHDGGWSGRYQGQNNVISSKNDVIDEHQEEEISQRYIAQMLSSVLMGGGSAAPATTSTYTVTIPTSFTFVSIVVTSKVPNFCLH